MTIILRQGVPGWHMSEVHLDLAQHIPSHQMPWPQSLHSLVVDNLGWASAALAFHIDGCQSTQLTQSCLQLRLQLGIHMAVVSDGSGPGYDLAAPVLHTRVLGI